MNLLLMTTFKIFLRTDHQNSNGTNTVYIRLIKNRKKKDFSLKLYVQSKHWNPAINRIRKTGKDFVRLNRLITKYENKAQNIIDDHIIKDEELSFNQFFKLFRNSDPDEQSFLEFVSHKLENRTMAEDTYKSYKAQVSKLSQFRKKIAFTDLNPDFIHRYKKFLVEIMKNNENTTNKSLRILKVFINWAIEDELMEKNPFSKIKTKHVDGKREYLNMYELEKLQKLYDDFSLKNNLHNVLRYFLFSCYTGLRYNYLKDLKFKDIKKRSVGDKEIEMIEIFMHKTKMPVSIPITQKAKKLLPKRYSQNQTVFNILTNQKKNAVGVILTGMGKDGAEGLKKMKEEGAYTIAQDENTCIVYGMPKAAVIAGVVNEILPIARISNKIIKKHTEYTYKELPNF